MLDEVRFWNIAHSQSEIVVDMNRELMGNETGLVTYYQFNQGTCRGCNDGQTTLFDVTANANNGTLENFLLSGFDSNWVCDEALYNASVLVLQNASVANNILTLSE